jgi:hypothetical protein
MIDGAIRITGNFSGFAAFGVDQNPASPMAHPAVAFNHGVKAVDFHFPFDIGVFEFGH